MKMNGEAEASIIQHFSHPHRLTLYKQQQTLNLHQLQAASSSSSTCACCKQLNACGWIYSCKPCNYWLHISCSQMPQAQQIAHPFDHKKHVLSLLPRPTYPDGAFSCDACTKHGTGFAYHCGHCNIDLHTTCAAMPLAVTHQSHPHHQLTLTFSLPSGSNHTFICDICTRLGRKEWLYLCTPCGFTAHLGCATATPAPPPPTTQPLHQPATVNHQAARHPQYYVPTISNSAPNQFQNYVTPNVNYNGMAGASFNGSVRPPVNNMGNAIMNQFQNLIGLRSFGGNSSNQQAHLIQQYSVLVVVVVAVLVLILEAVVLIHRREDQILIHRH